MKKLLALIALVAVVSISSVAYGITDDTTVTVNLVETFEIANSGCTSSGLSVSGTDYNTKGTGSCTVTYSSNDSVGYQFTAKSEGGTNTLDNTADTIAAMTATAAGCTVIGTECWSFHIGSPDDGTVAEDDRQTVKTDYNVEGHNLPHTTAVEIFQNEAAQVTDSTFVLNVSVQVSPTTDTVDNYTDTITLTLEQWEV